MSHTKFNQISSKLQCRNDLLHMVKRSRATTSCHLQTSHHPLATTICVYKMWWHSTSGRVHMPSKKISVQGMSQIWALHAVNVSKRNNILNRNIDNQRHIRYKSDEPHSYLHNYSSESSSEEYSFCLQVKVHKQHKKAQQPSTTTHLITNIAYKLKLHHTRNKYLQVHGLTQALKST